MSVGLLVGRPLPLPLLLLVVGSRQRRRVPTAIQKSHKMEDVVLLFPFHICCGRCCDFAHSLARSLTFLPSPQSSNRPTSTVVAWLIVGRRDCDTHPEQRADQSI